MSKTESKIKLPALLNDIVWNSLINSLILLLIILYYINFRYT